MTAGVDLVDVELLALPLALYGQASEHHDELRRELALIHQSTRDPSSVPARLQRLVDQLQAGLGRFTAEPSAALRQALANGDETIDLVYRVPPQARGAPIELGSLLDEADAFCRDGQHLLTLSTPAAPLAFRRWFLGEFAAQIDGADPTPWDRYATATG